MHALKVLLGSLAGARPLLKKPLRVEQLETLVTQPWRVPDFGLVRTTDPGDGILPGRQPWQTASYRLGARSSSLQ